MANNQLLASDNFSSGSLAAGWSAIFGLSECQVVSGSPNSTEPTALSTNCGQMFTGVSWPNDQTSEVIANLTKEANTFLSLYVRLQSGSKSGYQCDITNGIATLYVVTNGTATEIGSASGLTFASGDRFSLQAAGASLALYQNNKPLIYAWDTTYPAGAPGYSQYSTVNVAHTLVASWSGYSGVQQDGIWTKKGVLLPALSSFAGNDVFANGTQNPCIIVEGEAKILSGTVLKMIYQAGLDLNYAESVDGEEWTQYSGNPVLAHTSDYPVLWDPAFIKVGDTYHLYAGASGVYHFTSSDLLDWSSGELVFSEGTSGDWDGDGVWFFTPVFVDDDGTWYAMYLGYEASPSPGLYSTGLATSPDGSTWGRYDANPVIVGCQSIRPVKVGGLWYGWSSIGAPGQNATQSSDPGEGGRFSSPDLKTWTGPVHSAHHSQMFENANGVNGGFFPQQILDVNGKAYLYGTSIYSDLDANGMQQISLAIAPASISQIVAQPEDALQQIAADTFQRANESPLSDGGNWTSFPTRSGMQIVSDVAEPATTGSGDGSLYSGASFSDDQYSSITIGTIGSGGSLAFPVVRGSASAFTQYFVTIPATGTKSTVQMSKAIAGTSSTFGPTVAVTPEVGDVFTLSVIGQVLSLFQKGFLLLQVEDGSIASGLPGFGAYAPSAVSQAKVTAWAGGNANVIPTYTDAYDPTKPFLGSVTEADVDGGGPYVGYVNVIGSAPEGLPNPYLGNHYAVSSAPTGDNDTYLGQVVIVDSAPAGDGDPYVGHIREA